MAAYNANDTSILLESGTNELELLEFNICGNSYGINIAKVREIMMEQELVPMPQAPDEIEGVFMPRDKLITVIDLHKVLGTEKPADARGLFIICEFNGMDIGFHVTAVQGIQRIGWTAIDKPPQVSGDADSGIATGIAKVNGKILVILDFEKIVSDINKTAGLDLNGAENVKAGAATAEKHIVIAEDSQFLNKMIVLAHLLPASRRVPSTPVWKVPVRTSDSFPTTPLHHPYCRLPCLLQPEFVSSAGLPLLL